MREEDIMVISLYGYINSFTLVLCCFFSFFNWKMYNYFCIFFMSSSHAVSLSIVLLVYFFIRFFLNHYNFNKLKKLNTKKTKKNCNFKFNRETSNPTQPKTNQPTIQNKRQEDENEKRKKKIK